MLLPGQHTRRKTGCWGFWGTGSKTAENRLRWPPDGRKDRFFRGQPWRPAGRATQPNRPAGPSSMDGARFQLVRRSGLAAFRQQRAV